MDEMEVARTRARRALEFGWRSVAVAVTLLVLAVLPIGSDISLLAAVLYTGVGAVAIGAYLLSCQTLALYHGIAAWREWRGKLATVLVVCSALLLGALCR